MTWRGMLEGDRNFDDPNLYNSNDVSNFTFKIVAFDMEGYGLVKVLCIDWLPYGWGNVPWSLPEDYLCLYAINTTNASLNATFGWNKDISDIIDLEEHPYPYEAWMTEQFHTFPDLYTEIDFKYMEDDKDQKYMLTSSWTSWQSHIRVPYYFSGAGYDDDDFELFAYVPPGYVYIEAILYLDNDGYEVELDMESPNNIHGDDSDNHGESFFVSVQDADVDGLEPGLWSFEIDIESNAIDNEFGPCGWELYIEVRTLGSRVKFWYDPDDSKDIYVNTAPCPTGDGEVPPDNCMKFDADMDCDIDFSDLIAFALAYQTPANYNPAFDNDDDGTVDFDDLILFALNYNYDGGCASCDAPPWQPWP
jgi:hypothetical protein